MFYRRSCKSEIKIDRNVIFNNQVLQNGCKYTQDSTTLLFSINFIALNLNSINGCCRGQSGGFGGLLTKLFTKTFVLIQRADVFFVALVKSEIKIENNVKKVKKVLQNGHKYPQNSSTLLFSINFIHFNAKIVKNYYGAPPPPELS